jgi:hypothetical protein
MPRSVRSRPELLEAFQALLRREGIELSKAPTSVRAHAGKAVSNGSRGRGEKEVLAPRSIARPEVVKEATHAFGRDHDG